MKTIYKNQKNNLADQIQHLSEEIELISNTLKNLDLDEDVASQEINYLGDCMENRSCDANRIMDELYDLSNKVKNYKEQDDQSEADKINYDYKNQTIEAGR